MYILLRGSVIPSWPHFQSSIARAAYQRAPEQAPHPICLINIQGYHIECADKQDKANGDVHVVPRSFFTKHNIPLDYDSMEHSPYENNRDPTPRCTKALPVEESSTQRNTEMSTELPQRHTAARPQRR
ncbi:hypothetical protein N7489_001565 [Penicillium chrysogenum]|uniref:uncharacterized protein n=1 Tax=Penicillium chrysogenum TaxID=5076 RepID=UPI0024DF1204|nr:uncharacterized protein N7489_001565 [Penicillium chrysogenum]KAJ5251155.1 hypothetical protein N7489_001565 [Penicillium chrysogenum]